jgi:hypothetical protein
LPFWSVVRSAFSSSPTSKRLVSTVASATYRINSSGRGFLIWCYGCTVWLRSVENLAKSQESEGTLGHSRYRWGVFGSCAKTRWAARADVSVYQTWLNTKIRDTMVATPKSDSLPAASASRMSAYPVCGNLRERTATQWVLEKARLHNLSKDSGGLSKDISGLAQRKR